VRAIHPEVEIGWDGGASVENAYSLAQGGVDVINVGGAIASATDPQAVYAQFVSEVNKQGVM
jgi:ribulose-phosphate 3-epimerase